MSFDTEQLCEKLADHASELDRSGKWPSRQLEWCAQAGVFRWFVPTEFGGEGWHEQQLLNGYLQLSQSCLSTTFILTQWHAACRRIVGSSNVELKRELLPKLARGELFATVGISHLTTSRQHVGQPVLSATEQADGSFLLNGFSPWVTGAAHAELIVVGATFEDGRQLLAAITTQRTGVVAHPGAELVALSSSCTDKIELQEVRVERSELIAGPILNVMQTNSGGGAGGLQTSTLAVGLAIRAVAFLRAEATQRTELLPVAEKMGSDCQLLLLALRDLTGGGDAMTAGELRQQANSLVLRSTQAALQAAKGAGFMAAHPTGRWAREALFFLVWSCPQAVAQANLCELAQLN